LLDGDVDIQIRLRSNDKLIDVTQAIKGRYSFTNVPDGVYEVRGTIDYKVVLSKQTDTCTPQPVLGLYGGTLPRTADFKAGPVFVKGGKAVLNIIVPPPLVMVHGILNHFDRWDRFADGAALDGFLTITPNYDYVILKDDWQTAVDQVRAQIIANLSAWSSRAANGEYPPWVFIGHSQGGLIGRVIASSNDALARAMRSVYTFGTPNNGADGLVSAFENLAGFLSGQLKSSCFDYLKTNRMTKDFNPKYPTFGNRTVLAIPGSKTCNLSVIPGVGFFECHENGSDSVVEVQSAISIKSCKGSKCSIEWLPAKFKGLYEHHLELAKGDASFDFFWNTMLPSVSALIPTNPLIGP
jgi:hypothetical protein